ncbi:MAG: hypothetical protein M1823_002430 [Watsoniomyces obsoletus]|nr:MAG: hypothetical protein M1823_002430 [Watsoniomyces obsoletus]
MSPEFLAVSTQLELYLISTLFFARESLRVALQRQTDDDEDVIKETTISTSATGRDFDHGSPSQLERHRKSLPDEKQPAQTNKTEGAITHASSPGINPDTPSGKTQTVVNLSYISLFLGLPLSVGLAKLYLSSASSSAIETPWFQTSLMIYGIAAVGELLTEPCFVVAQQKMLYRLRATAESTATMARCFVTGGVAMYGAKKGMSLGVLPFAAGQLAYAMMLFIVYFGKTSFIAAEGGFSLFLKRMTTGRKNTQYTLQYFSRPLLALSGSLFVQSAVKHVLTQGDSFLIATLASLRDQGIYALASNYGGLLARMLFQPIEESSRNLFAKLLSLDNPGRDKPSTQGLQSARKILGDILRLYLLLAVVAGALGPSKAPLLLRIVAGERWTASGAGDVLATYCYYIPLLAINGVTEAFVSAVATPGELNRQSIWMFAFSIGFAGAGYVFLRVLDWGAQGLVWANVVNMLFRIIWSGAFITRYFGRYGQDGIRLTDILPTLGTLGVGIAAASISSKIQVTFTGSVIELAKPIIVVLLTVVLIVSGYAISPSSSVTLIPTTSATILPSSGILGPAEPTSIVNLQPPTSALHLHNSDQEIEIITIPAQEITVQKKPKLLDYVMEGVVVVLIFGVIVVLACCSAYRSRRNSQIHDG